MKDQNSRIKRQNKFKTPKIKEQKGTGILNLGFWICFGSCILILGFGSGCAKTVTVVGAPGEEMVVQVTLRGDLDVNANRYFLVLGTDSSLSVPLPAPDLIEDAPEMIEPGGAPLIGSEEAYYTNFYDTWSAYIVFDPAGYSLVNGPFTPGQAVTREVIAPLGEIGRTISFNFRLERAFASLPDQIYFDFVAVPWPDGAQKVPADHLPSSNNYIFKAAGSIKEVADWEDGGLSPDLDILGCKIEVQ